MIEPQSSMYDAVRPLRITAGDMLTSPRVSIPPDPNCEVCVVIPVRDEQDTIAGTLAALVRQVDLSGRVLDPTRFEIIVLANNCSDRSANVARDFAANHPALALHVIEIHLPASEAHVGMARRLLMDEAHRRLALLGKPRAIIATTDADTLASPLWIAETVAEVRRGADAVGGRIILDPRELRSLNPAGRECHLRDVGYRSLVAELDARLDPDIHDPWPRHFQHFGASLAVTADMYLRAGRLPVKPWFEDVAFFDALKRADARFRHSPNVQVTTSGRRTGRTGFGFAVQLTRWENMDPCAQPLCVESAQAVEARFTARRQLRQAWQMRRHGINLTTDLCASLAAELDVDPVFLHEALNQPSTFGMLAEQVEHSRMKSDRWHARLPLVDIGAAISDLRFRLDGLRRSSSNVLSEEIQPVQSGALPAQVV